MKNSGILKEELLQGKYSQLLKEIYLDESMLEYQNKRYADAITEFEKLYGEKEVEVYSAPGRSEVCGNHTDHQLGMVLATSINLDAIAVVSKTEGDLIRIVSEGYDMVEVDVNDLEEKYEEEGTTAALIRGVVAKVKEEGYRVGGFEAYVTSDVLIGAGLSSSAAFEIIVGTILSGLFNEMSISPVFLAQAGQLSTLTGSVDQLNAGMQGLNSAIGTLHSNLATLNNATSAQFPTAIRGITALNKGFAQLSGYNDSLVSGANKLKSNSPTLVAGVNTLQSGTNQLASGLNTLGSQMSSGSATLAANSSALRSGASELQSGAKELAEGMAKFDKEGTSKLKSTVEDELGDVLDRIDVLTSENCKYSTFSGKDKAMDGNVKFVIETDAIE